MAIIKYKPTSNGRRNMSTLSNDRITKSTPEKSLLAPKMSKGGQMARAAGCSAQILGFDGPYATLRLSSGEIRKVRGECRATVGIVGNEDISLVNLGKAGRNRWKGVRPTVRGSAMNPVDHPHGGGEGKCPVGRKSPMTPWGKKAMGVKTRKHKKASNALIMTRRNGK